MKPTQKQITEGIACIVIGGCANGTLLKAIRADAQFIKLARPDHIKPLKSSKQAMPEIETESDEYEVHPISLKNSDTPVPTLFAIAVVKGKSLTWAFSQLVIGFVEMETIKLANEGVITNQ